MTALPVEVTSAQLERFCQRWMVRELALFGSIVRGDFRPDSDVDVLVDFADDAGWGLFELAKMIDELQTLFGRPVDLLTRRSVERSRNQRRRERILGSARVIYAT